MQELLEYKFYGNTIVQWLFALVMAFASILVAKIMHWVFGSFLKKFTDKSENKWDDIFVTNVKGPIALAIALIGIRFSLNYLVLPDKADLWINRTYHIFFVLNISWFLSRLIDSIFTEIILPFTKITETELDDLIVPLMRRGLKIIIWSMGLIIGLNNAGYDVGALVAGLGVGGVALVFAARSTLANIFGGITIFIDQPFSIKDKIRVRGKNKGIEGSVKEVGLRLTTIITREGTELMIPNYMFNTEAVENVSRGPSKRILNYFKLDKMNSPEKVESSMSLLKEIALNDLDTDKEEGIITNLQSIEDNYLGVLFIYFIKKDKDDNLVQTRINLEILKKFKTHEIAWAMNLNTSDYYSSSDNY
jgi:MscS family membrane protein